MVRGPGLALPTTQSAPPANPPNAMIDRLPLLMLRILAANDIDIFPAFPPYALAAIAEFLHGAADFHPSNLLERLDDCGNVEGAQCRS